MSATNMLKPIWFAHLQLLLSKEWMLDGLQLASSRMKMVKYTWGNFMLWCVECWPYLTAMHIVKGLFPLFERTEQTSLGWHPWSTPASKHSTIWHQSPTFNSRMPNMMQTSSKNLWSWITDSCFVLCYMVAWPWFVQWQIHCYD